ncbi:MAG: hypothetical protein DWH91_07830 [Planctomycetota bacterium]|nr:MAG: hypothetical protein DWH91_07830 [Planctomycetota bacterium]
MIGRPQSTKSFSLVEVHQPRRCGTTMVEMAVAVALIAALISILVPILSRAQVSRTEGLVRERALTSVVNLLERASLLTERTPETLAPLGQEMIAGLEIPDPLWTFERTTEADGPLVRLQATLSWSTNRTTRSSVALVRWYPGEQP